MRLDSIHMNMLSTLDILQQTKSFSETARRVGRTQPAVSYQIRRLEQALGFELLKHQRGAVVFTTAGLEVAARARQLMQGASEILLPRVSVEGRCNGARIGVTEDVYSNLRTLGTVHSGVHFRIACSGLLKSQLEVGELDIALVKTEERLPHAIAAWRIDLTWQQNVVGHPDEPAKILLLPDTCAYHRIALQALKASRRPFVLHIVSNSLAAIREALPMGGATVTARRILPNSSCERNLPELPPAVLNLLVSELALNNRSTALRVATEAAVDAVGFGRIF